MKIYPIALIVFSGPQKSWHGAGECYGRVEGIDGVMKCVELVYMKNVKGRRRIVEIDHKKFQWGIADERNFTVNNVAQYTFLKSVMPREKVDGPAYCRLANNQVVEIKPTTDGATVDRAIEHRSQIMSGGSDFFYGEIKGDIFEIDL